MTTITHFSGVAPDPRSQGGKYIISLIQQLLSSWIDMHYKTIPLCSVYFSENISAVHEHQMTNRD